MKLLEEGTVVKGLCKIKKNILNDENFQLYYTNLNTYAIFAPKEMIDYWTEEFGVENVFNYWENDIYFYVSQKKSLISSLEKGPFPLNKYQLENFAIAFLGIADNVSIEKSLFIEELTLILPNKDLKITMDNETVFGYWLTGGAKLSIEDTNSIEDLVKWIPECGLHEFFKEIGCATILNDTDEDIDDDFEDDFDLYGELNKKNVKKFQRRPMPCEPFKLIGRPDLEKFFNENIVNILKNPEAYKRVGIDSPGGILLYGKPGCGKTFAVERLVEYLGVPVFRISSSNVGSKFIHETGKLIGKTFDDAIKNAPSVVVIDELEAFCSARREGSWDSHIEEVDEFLRKIPEAIEKKVIVIGMTNLIDLVDEALKRRGRFDHLVEVASASLVEIEALLKAKFETLPISNDVDSMEVAKSLENRPLSDVTFILKEAGKFSVIENKTEIDRDCFIKAINMLPKVKKEVVIGFK